ncbi:valine--tRNA ligase [Coxiella endosymbiont of Amblyomma americanum]|uniref:valine--tRNA ligase n=1 Tax=Coxiella endosymbiont of Amblyomma americanum TaxID=325775 RepID=UPI00057FC840|nr:valine--tRNA ligase [Coxiella endosymbiont of Amblyomma americanum]AJC50545.1 valyl-tRNA synthetase [Coxiella endosymbiont of Amblyomma americanum]AUJ58879.1 valine--tRNA ligase [Coxiella-like endosymbiont of Amblyomma americanum]
MKKTYDPKIIEKKWADYWEKHQLNRPSGSGNPYCIILPPPNVTGILHMGHSFQQTLMDVLARYHRMQGNQVLWQGGTDHAGIATQIVVEQQLAKKGYTRHDLGRKSFIDKVWKWRNFSRKKITCQMRRLGTSIDWTRERFSMDEGLSRSTIEAFVRLYHEGLIYRGKRLVNWDPVLKTAVSDLEVISEAVNSSLWYIRYPLAENAREHLIVATTRPETLLGDVAIAVHPDNLIYQKYIGKAVHLPLTNRIIPIISDISVNNKFGTGSVKITPAHDFNDYEIGQRHQLPLINIFTTEGRLNENVPQPYRGLDRFDARKKIVTALRENHLLEKIEPYRVFVPKGERSGVIIEPLLTDQWFLRMQSLSEPAMTVIKSRKLKFIPNIWEKTYLQWLTNIKDWCISRQLWWGHRLPVWYDERKNCYIGLSKKEIRKKYHLETMIQLEQETDVLDTWFSASLWPFATLGWPKKTEVYKNFYPTQILVTGFDILFFWVARMIMMGLKFTGEVPFQEVYVHGLICDNQGKKMSKSKGNIIDPLDIIDGISLENLIQKRTHALLQPNKSKEIEKLTRKEFPQGITSYGTDALRFTFCTLATNTGRNITFDMYRIKGYRNFCNKIWNSARFVIMHTKGQDLDSKKPLMYNIFDRWIMSFLQQIIKEVRKALNRYRFDLLAKILYEFVWNEYCDWYIEFAKCILHNEKITIPQKRGTRITLLRVLKTLLRLLHPLIPFITEEIWHTINCFEEKKINSIMIVSYPKFNEAYFDNKVNEKVHWFKNIITVIRVLRAEINISPSKATTVIFSKGKEDDRKNLQEMEQYIKLLGKVRNWQWIDTDTLIPVSVADVVDNLEIHIPLSGLIHKGSELTRLRKEITKLTKEEKKSMEKLSNSDYVKKAPEEVVKNERILLDKTQKRLKKLTSRYINIENL